MIPSAFSLDHRLSEIRPTNDDLRVARELRDAAVAAARPAGPSGQGARRPFEALRVEAGPSRLATR